ncbi:MAG: integrase core domain-containing protein [Gaiellaceae bacterium]
MLHPKPPPPRSPQRPRDQPQTHTGPTDPRPTARSRFHQTMGREWAYGLIYTSHRARPDALPHWLHHYNHMRPHSALKGQPPTSRVHTSVGRTPTRSSPLTLTATRSSRRPALRTPPQTCRSPRTCA